MEVKARLDAAVAADRFEAVSTTKRRQCANPSAILTAMTLSIRLCILTVRCNATCTSGANLPPTDRRHTFQWSGT
eukprot:5584170-Pyramimonas_sp.AAC.1